MCGEVTSEEPDSWYIGIKIRAMAVIILYCVLDDPVHERDSVFDTKSKSSILYF